MDSVAKMFVQMTVIDVGIKISLTQFTIFFVVKRFNQILDIHFSKDISVDVTKASPKCM